MTYRCKQNHLSIGIRHVLFASALALPAGLAIAQDAPSEEPNKLEQIVVTGSLLKRAQVEGPSPVVVIGRSQMDQQGFRTVQDVLDSLTQNTGGSLDQSQTFGFTPGASGINLRGFGVGRSLTMIDGRRLPVYPIAAGGSDNFVDVANIPTAMIERIEIVTDGASAIYGSDAISGVINIITRKDVEGVDVRARVGGTSDGGYDTREVEVSGGGKYGENGHVQFFAQYSKNSTLWAKDRDWAANDLANPNGIYSGYGANKLILDPETGELTTIGASPQQCAALGGVIISGGRCGYDRSPYRQLYPENDRRSLGARVDHKFGDSLNFFLDAHLTKGHTRTQLEPFGYQSTAIGGGGAGDGGIVPNNGGIIETPDGKWQGWTRRLVEFGPRVTNIDSDEHSIAAGLKGSLGESWDWESSVAYNKQAVEMRSNNFIMSALEHEIEQGLDLFERIPQSVVDKVRFTSLTKAASTNKTANLLARGELPLTLPGGNVALAVIGDYSDESFYNRPDQITLKGDAADGGSAGGGSRNHYGVGFEAGLPVLSSLQIDLAARYDHYQDAGSQISPRLAVQWRPLDNLLVRASAGRSFRAPDMQRLYGAQTRGFTDIVDTVRCLQDGGTGFGDRNVPSCHNPVQSVAILDGSNPHLKNEKGRNYNVGVVWDIIDGLAFKADFYRMSLKDMVASPDPQNILNDCATKGLFCNLIVRGPDGSLQTGQVVTTAQNMSFQSIRGVDFGLDYSLTTDRLGKFKFGSQVSYIDDLKSQLSPTSPVEEALGFDTLPKWKASASVNWTYGDLGATLRANYTHSMPGHYASEKPKSEEMIGRYVTFNAQVRYDLHDYGQVALGAVNLFNRRPPVDPTETNWPWYNQSYASPFGREIYLEWSKHW